MSDIEWTDWTWNPLRGCSIVSAGCTSCYAMKQAHRFSGPGKAYEGLTTLSKGGPVWTGKVRTVPELLDAPLRWRKPRRVFVNSMSDLFHEDVPDEFIDRVFATMAVCPHVTFQILTKRAERMRAYVSGMIDPDRWDAARRPIYDAARAQRRSRFAEWVGIALAHPTWPLRNVWLGVSTENQGTFDERVHELQRTPAAVRFVSYEPALGPIRFGCSLSESTTTHIRADVSGILRNRSFSALNDNTGKTLDPHEAERRLRDLLASGVKFIPVGPACDLFTPEDGCTGHRMPGLDWVIVGGESGPRARPCDVSWIRSTVEQCKAAGVPVFCKQMGRVLHGDRTGFVVHRYLLRDGRWWVAPLIESDSISTREYVASLKAEAVAFSLGDMKGGTMAEWPDDLRVREMPEVKP